MAQELSRRGAFAAPARSGHHRGQRGDREADVYELFLLAQKDPLHPQLPIRAEQDRRLQDSDANLWRSWLPSGGGQARV